MATTFMACLRNHEISPSHEAILFSFKTLKLPFKNFVLFLHHISAVHLILIIVRWESQWFFFLYGYPIDPAWFIEKTIFFPYCNAMSALSCTILHYPLVSLFLYEFQLSLLIQLYNRSWYLVAYSFLLWIFFAFWFP